MEAMKQLNAGLREAKLEHDAELEQPTQLPPAGLQKTPGQRQASFNSNIEAAAARQQDGGAAAAGGEEGSGGAPSASSFAAMLGGFLAEAQARQDALQQVQQQTEVVVRSTVTWLGESADPDPSPTFELLLKFCVEFDHAFRKVFKAAKA
jgi:hypothetical protein